MPDQNSTHLRDLHEGTEIELKLAALEHEVAEAAITVRAHITKPSLNPAKWWQVYQRIFSARIAAEDALIKFKAEEKRT